MMLDVDILLPKNFWRDAVPVLASMSAAHSAAGRPHDTLFSMERSFVDSPSHALAGRLSGCPLPTLGGCEAFLGYFQLYDAAVGPRYASWSNDVSMADLQFAQSFGQRHLLPGKVLHLGEAGKNWAGLTPEKVRWYGVELDF